MAFNEKENTFLDNIIRGASNEDLMKLEQADRAPAASDPTNAAQKQKPIEIRGNATVEPIEIPYTTPVNKSTPVLIDNLNPSIYEIERNRNDYELRSGKASETLDGNQNTISGLQKRIQDLEGNIYQPDAQLAAQIKSAGDSSSPKELPQRDLLSEAILSFGPAIFGGLTGEAGAISQASAGTKARAQYEAVRKEQGDSIQKGNEQALKRFKELLELRRNQSDSFSKNQQLELDRLKAQLTGATETAKLTDGQIKRYDDKAAIFSKDRADAVGKGAEQAAQLEDKAIGREFTSAENEKNRIAALARAKIMGQNAGIRYSIPSEGERKSANFLSGMQQAEKNINDIVKNNDGKYPSMDEKFFRLKREISSGQFGDALISDLLNTKTFDPKIRQQVQSELAFLESIGRINSGAAVGVKEWSSLREQYFPTYGDNLESIKQKEQQRKTAINGVKIMAGRSLKDVQAPVEVITQDAHALTKVINGINYIKTNGGWKKAN